MTHLKHLFTALLLLCCTVASAQNEVNGLYFVVTEDCCNLVDNPSGKYTGNIVIPESIVLTSFSYPNFSYSTTATSNKTYTFYAEAGSTITFASKVDRDYGSVYVKLDGGERTYLDGQLTYQDICLEITTTGIHTLVFTISGNKEYGWSTEGKVSKLTIKRNTEVELPVTSIGSNAFYGCAGLKSIEIPNSVTSIGSNAFYGCTGLKSIEIPNSVTSIGSNAFYGCTGLKSIEIPNSVTSIGSDAFNGCTGLKSIEIPNSVTNIGSSAFRNCTALTSIEIPNSVTNIGGYTFWGCSSLASIEIPNSVTSIENYAFNGCTALTSIAIESTTPPTIYEYTFPTTTYTEPLYVPAGAMTAYKAANYWKNFTNIYYIKPDYTEVTIEIGEYGCATYCSPLALDFSEVEGLKAYSAIGFNSSTKAVTLARVMTTAAETGIFLKGEPGKYTVPVIENCDEHTLNLLVGTLESITVNSTANNMSNFKFTVAEGDDTPMFYPFENGTTFSAGRAYLQIPTTWVPTNVQKSVSIRFDESGTTGIDEVTNTKENDKEYYDLLGCKVENPVGGIYIINGKKVIVK